MAAATAEQIQLLEKLHKEQFYFLAKANNFILNTFSRIDELAESPKNKFLEYIKKIERLAQIWNQRQLTLEKAGIPKFHPVFFNFSTQQEINDMIKAIDREGRGLGFIPIIIWGVIALASAFSAAFIVDQINDTAAEKQELIESTAQICKDLNLSDEQCKQLISQTSAGTGGMSMISILTLLALAYGAYTIFFKPKQTTQ